MNVDASQVLPFRENEKIKLSFFLGRKSQYKDKIVNMIVDKNVAEKLIEDLMRVIWENKVEGKTPPKD